MDATGAGSARHLLRIAESGAADARAHLTTRVETPLEGADDGNGEPASSRLSREQTRSKGY